MESRRMSDTTEYGLILAARGLKAARGKLDRAVDVAREAAIAANAGGVSESEIARTLGVNRLTVRRWLGK